MTMEQLYEPLRTDGRHSLPRAPRRSVPRRDRAERFIDLMCLLADGREWPAKRLSEMLKVTVRTIHRDMRLLEDRSLATRIRGRNGSYRLLAEKAWERPQLTLKELIALLIVATSAESSVPGQRELALDTVVKLSGLQPERVREPLLSLASTLRGQSLEGRQWLSRQSWLPLLVEGLVETRPLKVTLSLGPEELHSGPLTVVPDSLKGCDGAWLLLAHEVSPLGGSVTIELELVSAVEFDR